MKLDRSQPSGLLVASRGGLRRLLLSLLALVFLAGPSLAAATVTVQVLGLENAPNGPAPGAATRVNAKVPVTIRLTVKNGKVSHAFELPLVDGLVLNGSGTNPGTRSLDFNFFVTPTHPGDFTIPAFDIRTDDGQTLHVTAIKLHAIAW